MARKTKEESQRTRERILDAAEQIFARRGVSNSTIAHIADTAKISRGAIYGHYKNKVDVCLAMCRRAVQRAAMPPHIDTTLPVLDTLLHMGLYCLRQWLTPGSMQNALVVLYHISEDNQESVPLKRFRKGWELFYARRLRTLLRRAVAQGELCADLDRELAQKYINCTMTGIYNAIRNGSSTILTDWEDVERMLRVTLDSLRDSKYLRISRGSPPDKKSVPAACRDA